MLKPPVEDEIAVYRASYAHVIVLYPLGG